MNHFSLSKDMKIADFLSANPTLILLLPRFNIELGFGEKSINDICQISHINADFFLLICNTYIHDYIPEKETLSDIDMSGLIPYLLASHQYYSAERLPHIEIHLHHIADHMNEKVRNSLKRFFADYKHEVVNHFNYEEQIVFPYINKLSNGHTDLSFHIDEFEKNHSNIEDKLIDLTNIIIKYIPGNILPKEQRNVLFDLFQLSVDLNKHSLIEDRILVPYVESLENQIR